jgi:hypothetical protein
MSDSIQSLIEELFKDPINPEMNGYFIANSIIRKPEIFESIINELLV